MDEGIQEILAKFTESQEGWLIFERRDIKKKSKRPEAKMCWHCIRFEVFANIGVYSDYAGPQLKSSNMGFWLPYFPRSN